MVEIRSGKELCDEFFEGLGGIDGVDGDVCTALQQLYEEGQLTIDGVLSALKRAREEVEGEQQD